MSKHQGKFARKHPEGTQPDEQIAEAIRENLEDGRLSCAAASRISSQRGVSMNEIGLNADLMEARIHKCLFGLFGRTSADGEKIPVEPAVTIPEEIEVAIRARLEDGRLTCAAGWEVARETDVARGAIAAMCEALGIKISHCQLGAF